MRHFLSILAVVLTPASLVFAQSGYITDTYTVPQNTYLLSADFSLDGRPDLLLYGGTVVAHVMVNNGMGLFGAPTALPGTGVLTRAQVYQLDADNSPDIVGCVTEPGKSQINLVVYLNDRKGSFTIAETLPVPACASVNLADVNKDGHLDVIVTGNSNVGGAAPNNFVQTFFGDGTGHFSSSPVVQSQISLDSTNATSSFTQCGLTDTIVGDFYVDGSVSLIVNATCNPPNANPHTALGTTFLGHGNGSGQFTFTELREGNEHLTARNTASPNNGGDINRDGKPDALFTSADVAQDASNLYYAQNFGGGSFLFNNLTNAIGGGLYPTQFGPSLVYDFNNDGVGDIVTSYLAQPNGSTDRFSYISILYGSTGGTFRESQHWALGNQAAANVTDINLNAFSNVNGYEDIAAISYNSQNGATTLYLFKSNIANPIASCNAPTQINTNMICQPAEGAGTMAPVIVKAAANVPNFTLNRLYLDNVSVFESTSPIVNTTIPAGDGTGAGSHDLVFVSYNSQGQAFTSSTRFSTVPGGTCIPSNPGVAICQPSASSGSSGSPVTITAGAVAQSGKITAIRAYIDNVAVLTTNNPSPSASFQISESVAATPGQHHLVVVGYESTGGAITSSVDFTIVNQSGSCYPASPGAMICSPGKNASTASPVYVSAGATAGSGYLAAIRIYIDDIAQSTATNPEQSRSYAINEPLAVSRGLHRLVIVGYQSTGGAVTTSETFTVK